MSIEPSNSPLPDGKPYTIHVKAFPVLQLISVSMKGSINSEACHELIQKLTTNLTKVAPGFAYLNDMTLVDDMDFDTYQLHIEVMEIIREKGVKNVARVFGDSKKDIGFNLASEFHYDKSVNTGQYSTITEALDALFPS